MNKSGRAPIYNTAGLGFVRTLRKRIGIPESMEGLAATALAQKQPERAVQLWGAADTLREVEPWVAMTGEILSEAKAREL